MEKRDLLKFPIYNLDTYRADNLGQLLRGLEAISFLCRSLPKLKVVLKNLVRGEDITTFLEIAGAVVSGGLRGARGRDAVQNNNPKWGGLSGCTIKKARSWSKTTKDALVAAVYRQRRRIAAHCGSMLAIQ